MKNNEIKKKFYRQARQKLQINKLIDRSIGQVKFSDKS